MDAPPRTCNDGDASPNYPDDSIHASRRMIIRACLAAGLNTADADDLAQDLWEWLIRADVPQDLIATPWLTAAVRNYILRFRRRSFSRSTREGRSLESTPEPQSRPLLPVLESNDLLNHVSAVLPPTERRMLALIRQGYTIADAARKLGIPPGSRDFHKGRIVAYARREMQRRGRIPITRA